MTNTLKIVHLLEDDNLLEKHSRDDAGQIARWLILFLMKWNLMN